MVERGASIDEGGGRVSPHDPRDYERIVAEIATRFINLTSDEIEQGIHDALGTIGGVLGATRVYLGRFTEDQERFTVTDEWTAPGVPSASRLWRAVPTDRFDAIRRAFEKDDTYWDRARQDPVLESLREDGTIEELIAEAARVFD